MNEEQIRAIVQEEMMKNYNSGSPFIPPHSHNDTDNLSINPVDLQGFTAIPYSGNVTFLNPAGRGFLTSIAINNAGTGYVVGDSVTIIGGSDNNATAVVTTIGGGGAVASIALVRQGTGYIKTTGATTSTSGIGVNLTLNINTGGYEYGFASPNTLYPSTTTNAAQTVDNLTISQYPIPMVIGNGRVSGKIQGDFMGGAGPDGTLVGFFNGTNIDLYLRWNGKWYGANLTDIV